MASYVDRYLLQRARRGTDVLGRPLPETDAGMMELRKQQAEQERQDLQNATARRPVTGTMTLSNARGQNVSVLTTSDPITGRVIGVLPDGKRVLINPGKQRPTNRIGQTLQGTGQQPVMQNEIEQFNPDMLPQDVTPANVTVFKPTLFADGSSIVFDNAGGRKYLKPDGTEVTDPQEIGKLVAEGARSGIIEAQAVAFASDRGKSQAKTLGEFTEQMRPIQESIDLMNMAIQQIDDGAESGPIARLFPNFRQSTIRLNNIQQNLGLNVLQTTTFGALSAPELRLALDSTFPTNLQPQALKKFLKDKIAAQEKLEDYLFEAVAFMNEPGNTLDKFLVKRRAEMKRNKAGGTGQQVPGQLAPAPSGTVYTVETETVKGK